MKSILIIATVLFSFPVLAQHEHHAAAGGYSDSVNSGLIAVDTMKKSPRRVAMGNIGEAHVHIEYGSPGVRGREIWGGLVPYDKVWAAGAHNATKISFSNPVKVAGKKVDAGTYAFFLIPGKDKFTVILNKNFDQHLANKYDLKDDVLRVDLTPKAPDKMVQRLTYEVLPKKKHKGQVRFSWENKVISIPVSDK